MTVQQRGKAKQSGKARSSGKAKPGGRPQSSGKAKRGSKAKSGSKARSGGKAKQSGKERRPSDETPTRRFRSGRLVRLLLIGATVMLAAALGTSSVRTWINQREQIDGAHRESVELDARIASLEAEIATRTSDEGARIEALCFGPYVEPGVEVYSIPGVDGCVSGG